MVQITLNQIRQHDPCKSGWEKLLRSLPDNMPLDKPFDFRHIIESNGIVDAIWALKCIDNKELCVRFTVKCAESVLHIFEKIYPNDKRPRQAIEAAKKWLDNPSSEIATAATDAFDAAYAAYMKANAFSSEDAAARSAAYAADIDTADAHNAAAAAACAAARAAGSKHHSAYLVEREKQKQFLLELLKEYK